MGGESFELELRSEYSALSTQSVIATNLKLTVGFDAQNPDTGAGFDYKTALVVLFSCGTIASAAILIGEKKHAKKLAVFAIIFGLVFAPYSASAKTFLTNDLFVKTTYYFTNEAVNLITISASSGWAPAKTVTIEYSAQGDGWKNQYSTDNGATWNDYTGPFEVTQNNTLVKARTLDEKDTEFVTAEKLIDKIDSVTPTVSIELGDRYYSGEALDLATVTEYTAGESGATLKWYIDDTEISNMSDTTLIDRMEDQYEVKVKAVATSGAGLSAEAYSGTIIIKYARWGDYLIDGVITRDNIQSLNFVSWDEMPENPTGLIDNSVNQDGAVMEAYVLDSSTNLYDVYIASPYGYSRYKDDSIGSNYVREMEVGYHGTSSASAPEDRECYNSGLFAYLTKAKEIDFSYLDLYNITDMSCAFVATDYSTAMWESNSELTSLIWGDKFNTQNVKNMNYAFAGLKAMQNLDLSSFDVSSVERMEGIFAGMSSVESLYVANWNTSNVEDMAYVFYNTPSLKSLDVTGWDTSKVRLMQGIFYWTGLESLDLHRWNVAKVQTLYQAFMYNANLVSVDLSGWDGQEIRDMNHAFSFNPKLRSLNMSGFVTSEKLTDLNMAFYGDNTQNTGLEELDLSGFNTSNVTDFYYAFARQRSLKKIDFRHLNLSSVTTLKWAFLDDSKLQNIYVEIQPTIKAGAVTTEMWRSAGTSHFTVWDYSIGSPLGQ